MADRKRHEIQDDDIKSEWFETALPSTTSKRVWLRQVVPLLDQEAQRPINDHIEAARQFKERFLALSYEFSESERNQASSISPLCKKPVEMSEIALKALKLRMLRDPDEIITKRPSTPLNFKAWLSTQHAYYKAWLARL